jgi:hypothetical protein
MRWAGHVARMGEKVKVKVKHYAMKTYGEVAI